ncbi:MAG TPA: benzoyl-CoA reductase subunit D [Thermoanaerobaculia bacterium]|nr:benzoyl-CoA reductase subunit D [Thermoanaerobaculia bacterium]
MTTAAGIDVGTAAVKAVVMRVEDGSETLLSRASVRILRRSVTAVVEEAFEAAVEGSQLASIDYVATTGEAEEIPFSTGHFYGMTAHARGALHLEPRARAVLDVGALHARAVAMDERGRVTGYKMTSQCASGSGQFLENIARYLGVTSAEIGPLSVASTKPEAVSSICAVLAETDVINMVSRGIATADILRGIHESMASRFARLLQTIGAEGVIFVSGGIASDDGLKEALERALAKTRKDDPKAPVLVRHELSPFAGAIGAALWGAFRHARVGMGGAAWTANATV